MPDEGGPGFRIHKDRHRTENEPITNRTLLIVVGMALAALVAVCAIAGWVYVKTAGA